MGKFITSRRGFIKSGAAGAAVLAAPAYLRSTAARASGVVNVWTYANFIPDDFKAEFEKETGIEVRVRLVDDQGKQFNLLAAEAPEPSVDLVTVAGHRFLQFIDSDLLAPLDTDRLSNWGNINPVYSESDWATINGNKWGAPILSGAEVMAYNSEVVGEDEVKSWDVMFDPKYEGQTAYIIQDMMSVVMLYLGYDGNMIAYKDDPEKAAEIVKEARDFLIEHKPMVRKFYDSGAEVQQMFINQDIVLAHAWSGPISKLIMDGFPVDMTIPKEGSYGFVYTLNVTNNGPNQDNAYALLDALLSRPEVGAQMTKTSGFISTFKGVDQHLTELEQKAASFTEEELQGLQFFRAEANDLKYSLVDPAVEEIKAS
ncbi:ABC transporter substrate-binding protein [Chelativorans salis]|uniref:Extracellular solute-binding protein n=1 Tax=Chelativorans salis TaxID=2978478 RepID=A0ABT2LJB6_9HYPH|nr:extracellular solute-binding protein [Chelativorans sp. EGI FJ00035]MCT7374588.1 extracellular solute-binding protein [Chelativorans sp. EGI FJ00035]